MPKREGDARTSSAKSRIVINDPPENMDADGSTPAPAASQPPAELHFVTPAVSAEPAARGPSASKRRAEVQSPKLDSPSRPRPGRSSPPALGGPQPEPAGPAPRRARGGDYPPSPPPGCSTDALRIHFELVVKGFEQTVAHQAQQQAESQVRITKLETSLQRAHDELTADSKENHVKVKNEVFG